MTDIHRPSGERPTSFDVCVVGSFMADLVVRAARRPDRGETVIGSSCDTFLGGKGFNQAVAAARAGARTAMIGALGADDYGRQFCELLEAEHIDSSGVEVVEDVGTGIAFPVVEDSGENSIIIVPRANHHLSVHAVERSSALIAGAKVVLLQLELPVDTVIAAAEIAHRHGATVVLNPAPAVAHAAQFAGVVDIIVPNESELMLLTDSTSDDRAAAATLLSTITGAHCVVVTLGDRGALLCNSDGVTAVAPHAVQAIDTVGAGDAFCGMLAARLAAGIPMVTAVRHANAAGALATTRPGAEPAMPSRADVDRLLATTIA